MRYLTQWNNIPNKLMLDYARTVPTRVGNFFNAFDDVFERAMLPEEGTVITHLIPTKFVVKYDEDGVIKLEPLTEKENDSDES